MDPSCDKKNLITAVNQNIKIYFVNKNRLIWNQDDFNSLKNINYH